MKSQIFKLEEGTGYLIQEIQKQLDEGKKNIIVLVAGGTASGKTSAVASKIQKSFSESQIISMDNYYRGREYYAKHNLNFDQPEALDLDLFFSHLKDLKAGKTVKIPEYDFKKGKPEYEKLKISASRVIIVEGLFALHEQLRELWDLKIFVDLGVHSQILRRLFRDVERTGQNPSDILKYFLEVVYKMHKKYIAPTKEYADIILQNDYTPEKEAKNARITTDRLKYRLQIQNPKEIVGKLIYRLGGSYVGKIEQIDYYFNPNGRYLETGEMLNIRKIGFNKYFFSYFWPNDTKTDYEDRFTMQFFTDFETVQEFKNIYPQEALELSRMRRSFYIQWVLLCLDEYENGDAYIVFQFDGENTREIIAKILKELDLQPKDFTTKSYFQIYS